MALSKVLRHTVLANASPTDRKQPHQLSGGRQLSAARHQKCLRGTRWLIKRGFSTLFSDRVEKPFAFHRSCSFGQRLAVLTPVE